MAILLALICLLRLMLKDDRSDYAGKLYTWWQLLFLSTKENILLTFFILPFT